MSKDNKDARQPCSVVEYINGQQAYLNGEEWQKGKGLHWNQGYGDEYNRAEAASELSRSEGHE